MTYEDYCSKADVAAHKRVCARTQEAARITRGLLVKWTPEATLPKVGKQFILVDGSRWRVSMAGNSDNTTEKRAHRNMGASIVNAGHIESLTSYFKATRHIWDDTHASVLARSFQSILLQTLKGMP